MMRALRDSLRDFLSDGERAPNVLIGASVAIMLIGFVIAVAAILFMK